jgi:hypothetical protein
VEIVTRGEARRASTPAGLQLDGGRSHPRQGGAARGARDRREHLRHAGRDARGQKAKAEILRHMDTAMGVPAAEEYAASLVVDILAQRDAK